MTERKTISVASDPLFLDELSDYLEVLANPVRLRILRYISTEPRETNEIAEYIGTTYQNTKKHLDRLSTTGLVGREAGFGRETERGVAPVWKYSLVPGGLEKLIKTLGIFSSVAMPIDYRDAEKQIRSVRTAMGGGGKVAGPVLYVLSGISEGCAFILRSDRIPVGREDPDSALPPAGEAVVLPDQYQAVTRVSKPHAAITRSSGGWEIEDCGSTGGTYVNSQLLGAGKRAALSTGATIDLSLGPHGVRLLFVALE